jgi:hypothetical protein
VAALPALAGAQTVEVIAGEHDGFTRLVLQGRGLEGWRFGRTVDGYAVQLPPGSWQFDTARAFDIIPRTRLGSLTPDAVRGRIDLVLACPCHAVSFEFRPGIVVVDVRDGPPPAGSAGEVALEDAGAAEAPPDALATSIRPRARPQLAPAGGSDEVPEAPPYRWWALPEEAAAGPAPRAWASAAAPAPPAAAPEAPPAPEARPDDALQEMRSALLGQMAAGMAAGVIAPAEPGKRPDGDPRADPPAGMRLGSGPLPGLSAGEDRAAPGTLSATGEACPGEDRLDLAGWIDAEDPSPLAARALVLEEFDRPSAEALGEAVRIHLAAGFGAEAGQLLAAFAEADLPDRPILASLARLVDGLPDPQGALAAFGACDTPAALWAVLSQDRPDPAATYRAEAVQRAFSALPAHLRRHLGPRLVSLIEVTGDASTLTAIRGALARGTVEVPPPVALDTARATLADGEVERAAQQVEATIPEAGPSLAEAVLLRAEAALAQNRRLDPGLVADLEAVAPELAGGARGASHAAALLRVRAASGDLAAAVAALPDAPADVVAGVWAIAAGLATDDELLPVATAPAARPEGVGDATALAVAARLVDLGFAEAALTWIGAAQGAEAQVLTARAELLRRDGRAALRALAGLDGEEAERLRAEAQSALGDPAAAAGRLAALGAEEEALRRAAQAGDLATLAAAEGPWAPVAQAAAQPTQAPDGPLGRARAIAERAVGDRAAIETLLSSIARPEGE